LFVQTRVPRLSIAYSSVLQWRHALGRYRYMVCNRDYLNESELPRIQSKLAIVAVLAILAMIATEPFAVSSQTVGTLEPRFGQTLVELHQSETAGATSSEVAELVALLNKALELDGEAAKLSTPDQTQKRADLRAQVDQILTTVENRAAELTVVASQRSYTNRVLTYVGGAIAAVLGTIAYAFIAVFYQKYRVKRTFQMRVTRK
jgi:hypothetical protein